MESRRIFDQRCNPNAQGCPKEAQVQSRTPSGLGRNANDIRKAVFLRSFHDSGGKASMGGG